MLILKAPATAQADTTQAAAATVDLKQLAQPVGTTTAAQVSKLIAENSPLMQSAATTGAQQSASRGLLNSSMGIQAGQQAVLNAATPIAQATANETNQMSQFNAGQFNTALSSNAQNTQQSNQFNAQQQNAQNQFNVGQLNQATWNNMDANTKLQLADIEANYKTLMQLNSSAGSIYEQYLKNISDISMSDLDITAKTTAIQNQTTYLQNSLDTIQAMNNVTGMVTF